MRIHPLPLLADNYAYVIEADGQAVVIDPSEAQPVRDFLDQRGLRLAAIWCTHHHWDHTNGVEALAADGVPVVGSRYDAGLGRVPGQTVAVGEGDTLEWAGQPVHILELPGHTLGAISYHIGGDLFTGDVLFLCGCGRVFEGTYADMLGSLRKLRALPPTTRLWVGHEYTARNLSFALSLEPDHPALLARQRDLRAPSVPGLLEEEAKTSPFLRWDDPALRAALGTDDDASTFAAVRDARNRY